MANDTDWFARMAAAVKKRELAQNGLNRWQEKVTAAEEAIAALAAERERPDQAPSVTAMEREIRDMSPQLQPVFGSATDYSHQA